MALSSRSTPESLLGYPGIAASARRLGGKPVEILPGVDARPVSIGPAGLEPVAPHQPIGGQREGLGHQRFGFRAMDDTEDVRLTLAVRAGAGPTQPLERYEILTPVGPLDGELRADHGEAVWSHADSMPWADRVSTPGDPRSDERNSHVD